MSDITPSRTNIQIAEVQYASAVSESTFTRIGAGINFINSYQNKQFYFGAGGKFSSLTTPFTDLGIQEVFERASEIVNVLIRFGEAGSSGTSEFDLEWAADNSGTWATIFSTTPKVANTATNDGVFDANGVSTTPAGCTQPVLSKSTFAAGDKLRCNLTTAATGAADFIIVVQYRPL
jgi:hypothetical protein